MEIVIDIPEEYYKSLLENCRFSSEEIPVVSLAIATGTPLPKGHGKIVDIGKIDEDRIDRDNPIIYLTVNGDYTEAVSLDYLNSLPVLVEADDKKGDDDV